MFVLKLNARSERLEKNMPLNSLGDSIYVYWLGLSADLHLLEAQVTLALLLLDGHLDDGAHEQLVDGGAHQEDAEHAGRPNPPRSVHTRIPVSVRQKKGICGADWFDTPDPDPL